jgi:hypothetical protein
MDGMRTAALPFAYVGGVQGASDPAEETVDDARGPALVGIMWMEAL